MPDGFTHCLVGLVACLSWDMRGAKYYLLAVFLSLMPDIDAFTPWHRALLHSALSLTVLAVVLARVMLKLGYTSDETIRMIYLPFVHVLMDSLTGGMPVKPLYPLTDAGVQLDWAVDRVVKPILSISPYGYYLEVIRVSVVFLIVTLAFMATGHRGKKNDRG
ncbi:hypothetical protein DRO57_06890 [Candidatus Bathyarchaeota archaeon]|nr:MAG: hypothetical protein DRO57_06890 [Candidatus Bathyarchaeota archaeon]